MTSSPVLSAWNLNDGEPFAWVVPANAHPRSHHPLAGWRMKAEVYFNGHVRPHSAEFGSRYFTPAPFHGAIALPQLSFNGALRDTDFMAHDGARQKCVEGVAGKTVHPERRVRPDRRVHRAARPDEIEVEPCHVKPDPVHVEKMENILAALPKIKEIVTMIESVSDKQLPPSE